MAFPEGIMARGVTNPIMPGGYALAGEWTWFLLGGHTSWVWAGPGESVSSSAGHREVSSLP